MSIAAKIREMYDDGSMTNSPADNKVNHPQVFRAADKHHSIRQQVAARYQDCYEIARTKGYDLPEIPIRYDLKGVTAGSFNWSGASMYFRVNMVLARENIEHYLARTVPHEFCHYLVRKLSSGFNRPTPHGQQWKTKMIQVFGLEPERCHSYNVQNARVRRVSRPYIYKCACKEHRETSNIHLKILRGRRYMCKTCRGTLVYDRVAAR